MDPNKTLQALLEAFTEGNRDEALALLGDLKHWLVMGGFMPNAVYDPETEQWGIFEVPAETVDMLPEAALALVLEVEEPLNRFELNRALFYLDLLALRDLGSTVTNESWVARAQGQRMVGDMGLRRLNILCARPITTMMGDTKAGEDVQFHHITEAQRVLAKQIMVDFQSVWRTDDHLKLNPGWLQAVNQPGFGNQINMLLAMQQIAGHDSWIDEPADAALLEAIASVGSGDSTPWE